MRMLFAWQGVSTFVTQCPLITGVLSSQVLCELEPFPVFVFNTIRCSGPGGILLICEYMILIWSIVFVTCRGFGNLRITTHNNI